MPTDSVLKSAAPQTAYTGCEAPTALSELQQPAKRLQELVERSGQLRDPAARTLVQDCLQAVLAFYGHGLARVLQVVQTAGPAGETVRERLLQDPAVAGLLIIHGLHPVELETRLRGALDKVRPYLERHGGNVELLSLKGEFARLRLQGHCKTCPSSAVTLELAVRRALEEACPDLTGFEVVP